MQEAVKRNMTLRLKEKYRNEVRPALQKEFHYSSPMAIPKIAMIKINIGMGEAIQNSRLLDGAVKELAQISGQKPVITKAKKSIAAFKLREGTSIGAHHGWPILLSRALPDRPKM